MMFRHCLQANPRKIHNKVDKTATSKRKSVFVNENPARCNSIVLLTRNTTTAIARPEKSAAGQMTARFLGGLAGSTRSSGCVAGPVIQQAYLVSNRSRILARASAEQLVSVTITS